MDHKLRILVRLDVDSNRAVVKVAGCLTSSTGQLVDEPVPDKADVIAPAKLPQFSALTIRNIAVGAAA